MNEIRLKTVLLCDSTILDQNRKISLLGVFDQIYANKYPAAHPQFELFTLWEGKEGEYRQKVIIKDPDDVKLLETELLTFPIKNKGKAQVVNKFIGVPIPKKGQYKIEIYINDNLLYTHDFTVAPQSN